MTGMANHQDMTLVRATTREMALCLTMHLRDQRTSRIQIQQVATLGLSRDRLGNAMGGENDMPVFRNFIQFLDENGALGFSPSTTVRLWTISWRT